MGIENRDYYRDSYEPSALRLDRSNPRSMVVILIAVNVAIWLLDAFTSASEEGGLRWLASNLALENTMATQPWMWWKLLTYGFAHASVGTPTGIWHLFGNMFGLFVFGRAVEQKLGRYEFLRFYLISVVFAGVCWMLISLLRGPGSVVGASGAVTAVIGLFVFSFPRDRILLFSSYQSQRGCWALRLSSWIYSTHLVPPTILQQKPI